MMHPKNVRMLKVQFRKVIVGISLLIFLFLHLLAVVLPQYLVLVFVLPLHLVVLHVQLT